MVIVFQANSTSFLISILWSYNPNNCQNNCGLGCSQFDRLYYGNNFCFLFLQLLRCFSSPGSLSLRNDIASLYRVAPFGNLRINSCLALTRSLSQLATSFIASESLGIRHAPLVTFFKPILVISYYYKKIIKIIICWNQTCWFHLNTSKNLYQLLNNNNQSVENIGVEPMTPCVQGRCSGQLS